ncbi:hypothetical protein PanWU01x14_123730 [Parasponia andersonii]|uniref:Transmembrane protein n=1 Tax=Parasponia andersonii TaxID=3476 RepID=A0A2P5CU68_PARAD|nr:hypothetical protein PanWU01x14_123730 [Parasponia andersonii]
MKTFVALFIMLLIVLLENIEVSKAEQVNCSPLELGGVRRRHDVEQSPDGSLL